MLRDFGLGACDNLKLQKKHFADAENHSEPFEIECVEEVVDCKPPVSSSRACFENISRSRLQLCDANGDASAPSEEKLKSVLGECAYVARQLNSYGEAVLDNGSSGFLADAHANSREPSPMVESKVRNKGLLDERVSGILDEEGETVLQISGLTERLDSFQRMLNELK
ncbi:hypothetical protein GOP47_0004724 [Adiantum capillus-veneris]|uniref:Uncharacterized protein n=1 Tax=Adiantum capillus-veneris TaxID=13818 RepID=A0A9D4V3T3_ADICA|nr:hypothetical protein GOP47_0004724 [Adiantum capillus-veneris]